MDGRKESRFTSDAPNWGDVQAACNAIEQEFGGKAQASIGLWPTNWSKGLITLAATWSEGTDAYSSPPDIYVEELWNFKTDRDLPATCLLLISRIYDRLAAQGERVRLEMAQCRAWYDAHHGRR